MKKLLTGLLLFLLIAPFGLATLAAAGGGATADAVHCSTASATGWRPPYVVAYRVGSPFGMRFHPIHHVWRMHEGVDLTSENRPQDIVAANSGTITHAGPRGGYGNLVEISHGDNVTTRYGHLHSIDPTIRVGVQVAAGQRLGMEGTTGTSTAVHLHYEVRINGVPTDPVPFMTQHGSPLDGSAVPVTDPTISDHQGGIGFPLPLPGEPRLNSRTTTPTPIPDTMLRWYHKAADTYVLPWTLLAAIGFAESDHGRDTSTSWAGAQGPMQFLPATFATYGVDGDGDGHTDIRNPADAVFSAANYLTKMGVTEGPDGVRRALFRYNPADWYVNDVLAYAHHYGGGDVSGGLTTCPPGEGNPALPPLSNEKIRLVLDWARARNGYPYVFGANGPHAYDCSSFTQNAYRAAGITIPRTAEEQRRWLQAGNGFRVPLGQEQPGDLVFWDGRLGPNVAGHVMLVYDPTTHTSIEAAGRTRGVGFFDYTRDESPKNLYEIWRVGTT